MVCLMFPQKRTIINNYQYYVCISYHFYLSKIDELTAHDPPLFSLFKPDHCIGNAFALVALHINSKEREICACKDSNFTTPPLET